MKHERFPNGKARSGHNRTGFHQNYFAGGKNKILTLLILDKIGVLVNAKNAILII